MSKLEDIKELCHGIQYSRHVPVVAEQLAKENNIVIIVGGSDDLMYCYGAKCYLTEYCEHSYGWDGDDLKNIDDEKLEYEANQLGLKIFWCGNIKKTGEKIEGHSVSIDGAFSYEVNENIKSLDFKVLENKNDWSDVYCTGKIIQLPEGFKAEQY